MARRTVVDPRFPSRLRELRDARGLSLQQLAAAAHVGKSTISDLENGKATPIVDTARALDEALSARRRSLPQLLMIASEVGSELRRRDPRGRPAREFREAIRSVAGE